MNINCWFFILSCFCVSISYCYPHVNAISGTTEIHNSTCFTSYVKVSYEYNVSMYNTSNEREIPKFFLVNASSDGVNIFFYQDNKLDKSNPDLFRGTTVFSIPFEAYGKINIYVKACRTEDPASCSVWKTLPPIFTKDIITNRETLIDAFLDASSSFGDINIISSTCSPPLSTVVIQLQMSLVQFFNYIAYPINDKKPPHLASGTVHHTDAGVELDSQGYISGYNLTLSLPQEGTFEIIIDVRKCSVRDKTSRKVKSFLELTIGKAVEC